MKTLLRSFAGGEITPELYGRIDLTKYQTGLAKCLNFTVLPHGPAARRPGFKFINEARDSTRKVRLIPFTFSADQTFVLEFGHQYIRFHVNGATLLEGTVAISSIAGSTVNTTAPHNYSTGDWVYIGSRFHKAAVVDADTFTTTDLWGVATTASGATAARVYTLASPYAEQHLFDLHYAQSADVITITHPSYAIRDLSRVSATNWSLATVSFDPPASVPTGLTATATVDQNHHKTNQTYVVTAVADDGITETLPSASATANNNLGLAGNFNTLTWTGVAGYSRYNVYKLRGGIYGYIGSARSATGLTLVDDNILPDTSTSFPEDVITLNEAAGDYPASTVYYEQRRWFAGTANEPQTVWATRNATQTNLTTSVPARDDDALEFRIAAQQQNAIRHLMPLSDIIALTAGGEFRIFADNAPAISPTSLSVKPQGYSGASNVQPALTSGSILYVQAQGSHVRELAYNWQSSAYSSIDVSIMAPHLFNGFSQADLAFARASVPTLWAARSDGTLLGMTYVPEQQVYGWHQHTTDGLIESVCVVSEGLEDVLYAVIRRTINARTVRYIERLQTAQFTAQEDAFYVDSGLTYDGAPVSSVSGLWHLEGKAVQILADGAVHPARTVAGGAVTLNDTYGVVHVGLAYASDLKTLPLALEGAPAAGQYRTKNVNGVALRVTQSSLVKAGPSFAKLTEYPARDHTDPYDSPPALRTGELRFAIGPNWNADGAVCLRQDQPLPLTVLGIALDVATGS